MSRIDRLLDSIEDIERKVLDDDGIKTDVTISLDEETYAYLGVTVFIAGLLVMLANYAIQRIKD